MAYRCTFKKRETCLVNFYSGMVKNALSTSDSRILKSAISQEKFDESTWFMVCRYISKKRERCLVNFYLGMVKNSLSISDYKILKSSISQEKLVNQIDQKCSWPIRLQSSWINYMLSEKRWINSIFGM